VYFLVRLSSVMLVDDVTWRTIIIIIIIIICYNCSCYCCLYLMTEIIVCSAKKVTACLSRFFVPVF